MHYFIFTTKDEAIRFEQKLNEEGFIYTSIEPGYNFTWMVCLED